MTIYYVDPVGGNDTTGDGLTTGTAWASTQKALDNVTAGNDIYLMATGTETSNATAIIVDTNASAITTPINVYGASSDGLSRLDGSGVYTITGAGGTNVDLLRWATVTSYINFHDIRLTGGTRYNVHFSSGTAFATFNRCTIDGSTNHNVQSASTTGVATFIDCDVYGSSARGFNGGATNGNFHIYGCDVHDNAQTGVRAGGDFTGFTIIQDCRIYDNGTTTSHHGIELASGAHASIAGNTIYGNGGHGIKCDGSTTWITDNTISDNGSYGVYMDTSFPMLIDHNHYYNNTSGQWYMNGGSASSTELNVQTGDPLFMSVVDGSEDFTPMAGSPLIRAGISGNYDIGAVQSTGTGGARKWY